MPLRPVHPRTDPERRKAFKSEFPGRVKEGTDRDKFETPAV